MRFHTTAAVLATLAAAVSPAAHAGHPQTRQGFWIGFGVGYGWAMVQADCEDCSGEDREGSFTGLFKIGGTLSDRFLLGVEGNGWSKKEGGATLLVGTSTGTVTFYPRASSGFFLKAGAGMSLVDISVDTGSGRTSVSKAGFGLLGGLGYDIRVGRNISIAPSANYYWGKPGDLETLGEFLPEFKFDVFDVGVAITFH